MKIFGMLDRDKNGRLTYEELREGLLSMRGMHTIPPANIAKIIRQIDRVGASHCGVCMTREHAAGGGRTR